MPNEGLIRYFDKVRCSGSRVNWQTEGEGRSCQAL